MSVELVMISGTGRSLGCDRRLWLTTLYVHLQGVVRDRSPPVINIVSG